MIRVISTSLACIFEYPEVIDWRDLGTFLRERGFVIPKPKREEVFTESGKPIGEVVEVPVMVAYRSEEGEEIRIIYNNNANLVGYPTSSFVTVVSASFENTYETFMQIFEYIKSKKLDSDIRMYEATFTGLIEKEGLKDRIYKFFRVDEVNKFANLLSQTPMPVGFRIRGQNPSEENWFDLMFDTMATQNPKLNLLRLVIRYGSYDKYKELPALINRIIEVILDVQTET
jgi:hypothetical protein